MTIKKAKSSEYNDVHTTSIVDYIKDYAIDIDQMVSHSLTNKLESCDRAQLKAIASELETVKKRLKYALYGKY